MEKRGYQINLCHTDHRVDIKLRQKEKNVSLERQVGTFEPNKESTLFSLSWRTKQ